MRVCKEAVEEGLRAVKPWAHLGDVGAVVNEYAKAHGYTVVREFGGHGIGLEFHEDPFVSLAVKPWAHLGDVGAVVNEYAKAHGYTVVREFGGHGIGLEFHEDPFVSFVTEPGEGPIMAPTRTPSSASSPSRAKAPSWRPASCSPSSR